MPDEFDTLLSRVRDEMEEPVMTAELQVERKIDSIIRELDELCLMARHSETKDLIEAHAIDIGQIQYRSSLILGLLQSHETPKLRMVINRA